MLRVIDGSRDLIDADVSVTYCAAHAVPEYATHSRSLPSLFIDLVSPWGGGGGETICSPHRWRFKRKQIKFICDK